MAHVMVVDDDKDILRLVQKLLESVGHNVVTYLNPLDALDKWNNETFDLVLTDANMPHINGFDFIKTIGQSSKRATTAVALLTGRREKRDIERGLISGADDYLVKPIDPDIFLSKVQNLLTKKQGQKAEISFTEAATQFKALWNVETSVIQLSEQGVSLLSPITALPNSKIRIQSELFNLIGIASPILRVLDCLPDPSGSGKYLTRVSFVGLTEPELQKIRFWINMNRDGALAA